MGKKPRQHPVTTGLPIDPTRNVLDLVAAGATRADDLRELNDRRLDAEIRIIATQVSCAKEVALLRVDHHRELRKAESERLDSIRQVDREDVNKTAAQALSAIATLAAATTTTAETLRGQVATTAAAAQMSLANSMAEVNKRLSALELSQSSGGGEKAGRLSQQQLAMMIVTFLVGLVIIGGAVIAIAYAIRQR